MKLDNCKRGDQISRVALHRSCSLPLDEYNARKLWRSSLESIVASHSSSNSHQAPLRYTLRNAEPFIAIYTCVKVATKARRTRRRV